MAVVEFSLDIKAPIEDVYRVSQDYEVRYEWDPFPEKIEFLDGETEVTKGATVFVKANSGLTMEVKFIQVSPPTKAAVMMIKGPFILDSFAGSWIFKPLPNGDTHAIFRYVIKTKKWLLPVIADRIAAGYFRRAVEARLTGLKNYCERCEL